MTSDGGEAGFGRQAYCGFSPQGVEERRPGSGGSPGAGEEKAGSPCDGEGLCAVCKDKASGNFFGASVCLPCKSFFIRCTKDGEPTLQRQCIGQCDVSKQLRNRCQYCRFQRCLLIGMSRKEKPVVVHAGAGQELCRVCGDLANGVHFGVFTCEGCKKFFRRGLKEHTSYVCRGCKNCQLNPRNRNNCRYCRFEKCLTVGMSRDAIKMGRPRKIFLQSNTNSPSLPQPRTNDEGEDEDDDDTWPCPSYELSSTSEDKPLPQHVPPGHVTVPWPMPAPLLQQGRFTHPTTTTNVTNSFAEPAGIPQGFGRGVPAAFGLSHGGSPVTTAGLSMTNAYVSSEAVPRPVMANEAPCSLRPEKPHASTPAVLHPSPAVSRLYAMTSALSPSGSTGSPVALPGTSLQSAIPVDSSDSDEALDLFVGATPFGPRAPAGPGMGFSSMLQQDPRTLDGFAYLRAQNCGPAAGYPSSPPTTAQPQNAWASSNGALKYGPPSRALFQNAAVSCWARETTVCTDDLTIDQPETKKARVTTRNSESCDVENDVVVFSTAHETEPPDRTVDSASVATSHPPIVASAAEDSDLTRGQDPEGDPYLALADRIFTSSTLPAPPKPWKNSMGFFTPYLNEEAMYKINEMFVSAYSILEAAEGREESSLFTFGNRSSSSAPGEIQLLEDHLQTQYNFSPSQLLAFWSGLCTHRVPGALDASGGALSPKHQRIIEEVSRLYDGVLELSDETKYGYTPENGDMNSENPRWKKLLSRIIRNTHAVTRFAFAIPGMDTIHPNDRTLLVRKDILFTVTLIMSAREFYDSERRQFLYFWKTGDIAANSPMYTFQQRLQTVGYKAHSLQLDRLECALVYAFCILCHENGEFEDKRKVENVRDDVFAALTAYIAFVLHKNPEQRLREVFQLLPRIRLMGFWHTNLMKNMAFDIKHISQDLANLDLSTK